MRITASTMYRDSSAAIERTSERLLEFQRQVASGKRVEKPSDDPSAMASSIRERSQLANLEQYSRSADSILSRLTLMDSVLSNVIEKLSLAQTTALSARGTTKSATEREAAAQQLIGIRQSIYESLNTSDQGVYLFAGANSSTAPFSHNPDGTVSSYAGSAESVSVDMDKGRSVPVTMDGSIVSQGSAAADVFRVLDDLIAAVRAGHHDQIGEGMTALQQAFQRASDALTAVGNNMAAADLQQSRLLRLQVSSKTRISAVEDTNLADAITGMTQAEAAYQAALQSTARLTHRTLMDYLS